MTEPTQTTIYGAQEPLQAPLPHRSPEYVAVPLFTAPDAMRGQLHMPTDEYTCPRFDQPCTTMASCTLHGCRRVRPQTQTPSELHAKARCARLRPRSEDLPAYVERTTT